MMILRDIVKIENEKPEREEKGMGEVKQTNFRVDQETADKFRQFCMDAGMNQAQGFDHVMEVLEMDRAKEAVPGRATEIEEFERNIKAVMVAYMNSLEINSNAEERVREQFSAALDSKDKTIQDLQGQVARLQGEKDTAEKVAADVAEAAAQASKDAEAATEKAESASQLAAEKDRTINSLAEKLTAAEEKCAGYDEIVRAEQEAKEQIRTLKAEIDTQKREYKTEKKELQTEMERRVSDAKKDAALEVVNAVTEKEREMNAKILQVERENAKLQAKIELLEARLGKEEELLSN